MLRISPVSENVITVWKPVGLTPLETILLLQKENPEYAGKKIGYAGRLDPMAEGLLLLLVGDENKKRKQYEKLDKTYEFEMLFGIATDSYDVLGMVTYVATPPNIADIRTNLTKILPQFIGVINQDYPPYSSAKVNGKPLYWWARQDRLAEITLPAHPVRIYDLKIKNLKMTILNFEDIVEKITLVRGDFRQQEIIASWKNYFRDRKSVRLPKAVLYCHCSSGTYIRQLVSDLSSEISTPITTFKILRTSVNVITKKTCDFP